MPQHDWINHLDGGFKIIARRVTRRGKLVEFAVVLVFEDQCITRYDSAHDVPHRDVLGRKSALIEKEYYESLTNEEAFEHGINDLKANYDTYFAFYDSH